MRNRLGILLCSDSLLSRCARGGASLAAAALLERGTRFVRNMILARILAPDQFGLMAIVLAASSLFEALTEVGVRHSVIQNKRGDSEAFLNVAWWFSAVRGFVLYGVGVAAAPLIADFFHEPALIPLMRAAFLTMIFSGLQSTRFYVLQKHLQFGRYVWIEQGSAVVGTVVSLATVLFIPNVWALVTGTLTEAGVRCLSSFVFCPLRPRWSFDRACCDEFFSFARGMAGLPILTFLVTQMDVFFLGRMCSEDVLGKYALALALAQIPTMIVTRIVGPLTLPVLSKFQNDSRRLKDAILQITGTLWALGLPVFVIMASCGSTILSLTYGQSYTTATTAFAILCFYSQVYVTGTFIMAVYLAIGQPALHRRFAVLRVLLAAVMMYPAIRWFGATGAAGALLLSTSLASIVQLHSLSRVLDLPLRKYLTAVAEGVPAVVIAVPVVLFGMVRPEATILQLLLAIVLCVAAWGVGLSRMRSAVRGGLAQPAVVPVGVSSQ